jgi:hypothetical protein
MEVLPCIRDVGGGIGDTIWRIAGVRHGSPVARLGPYGRNLRQTMKHVRISG